MHAGSVSEAAESRDPFQAGKLTATVLEHSDGVSVGSVHLVLVKSIEVHIALIDA
jgi:hypothetical protein